MTKQIILAIDAGTTGNRVVAVNGDGAIVAKSYYEFKQHYPKPGWVEHDAEEIWKTIRRALHDVVDEVGAQNVMGIGITNQRETCTLWDRESGRPIHNAIVWQCRRTEDICNELRGNSAAIKEKTGLPLDPYFSATKIRWLLDNVDGAREKAESGQLAFGTIDTWILWKLTGGKVHATEPSNASRTMLFNIRDRAFDDDLLSLFAVPQAMLPDILDSDAMFGATEQSLFGREIPIHGILGDQQASLFSHCGWKKGVVKNTYGTGLFVMTDTQEDILLSDKLVTTVAWTASGKTNYALEGSIFMGGATLQWLRDRLGIIGSADESEGLARSISDNEDVYFVPALQGLGAPYWRADARGTIVGLSRRANRATIVRAALEAMAYQTRDVIDEMKHLLDFELTTLSVDGGACVNDFLMQYQSDILNLPVERPAVIERTALGAAGISGIASGLWSREDFAEKAMRIEKTYMPEMNEKLRDGYYDGWKKAVELSLSGSQA